MSRSGVLVCLLAVACAACGEKVECKSTLTTTFEDARLRAIKKLNNYRTIANIEMDALRDVTIERCVSDKWSSAQIKGFRDCKPGPFEKCKAPFNAAQLEALEKVGREVWMQNFPAATAEIFIGFNANASDPQIAEMGRAIHDAAEVTVRTRLELALPSLAIALGDANKH